MNFLYYCSFIIPLGNMFFPMLTTELFHLFLYIEIDTLEYQQTEKIKTELKDVDRIRIRKVYACCPALLISGLNFSPFCRWFRFAQLAKGKKFRP